MQTEAKDFWKLFKPSACALRLKAEGKREVFEELVANFVKAKQLPEELSESAVAALVEREGVASTGIGQNVAIPHVKLADLDEAIFSLTVHEPGLEWESVDGEPVQIFFTVLRPARAGKSHDPERHLEMMRWISTVGREPDFRRFALQVEKRSELVDLLKEMSGLEG